MDILVGGFQDTFGLFFVYKLFRVSESCVAAGFDFYEDQQRTAPGDQVDLRLPVAVVPRNYSIALFFQITRRKVFALPACSRWCGNVSNLVLCFKMEDRSWETEDRSIEDYSFRLPASVSGPPSPNLT